MQLDKLDGLPNSQGLTSNSGDNLLEVANFVREATMSEQNEKVDSQWIEPKTFQEAYNHLDLVQRKKWRAGIRKEFRDMISQKV